MSEGRKRKTETPSLPPSSTTKKVKVEDNEEEIVLQYQREHMLLRIKELNREKQQLMQQNDLMEKKLEDSDNLMNNINRYWNMLNENLVLLQKKYQGDIGGNIEQEMNKKVYEQLLEAFKRPPPEYSKKVAQEKKNDFEFLESRCTFTLSSFEFLLQSMMSVREESSKFNQKLHELAINQNDPQRLIAMLTSQNKTFEKDLLSEHSRADEIAKRVNELLNQNHELLAEKNAIEKQLFTVQQQRDDFEANSIIYQRKIDKLTDTINSLNQANSNNQSNNSNNNNNSAPQRPSAKVPPKKAAAAAASFQQSSELSSMCEEIKKLKEKVEKSEQVCNSRSEYIDKLIQEKTNLENEILNLNEQLLIIPPEKAKKAKDYIELKQKYDTLLATSNQPDKDQSTKLLQEYEKNQLILSAKLREKENHYQNLLKEWKQEIDNIKFELTKTTSEREELSYKLFVQKAPYSNKNTVEELTKLSESYRKELTKLRADVKSLTTEVNTLKDSLLEKKLNEETLKQSSEKKDLEIQQFQSQIASLSEKLQRVELSDKVDLLNELKAVKELNERLQQEKLLSSSPLNIPEILANSREIEKLKGEKMKLTLLLTEKSNQINDLNAHMESDKNFTDQLYTEINDLNGAIQEKEAKNETLMQQLLEKEDCISQLLHEHSKSKQQEKLLREQVNLCNAKIAMMEEKYQSQSDLVNSDSLLAKKLNLQLENVHKDMRQKEADLKSKDKSITELRNQVDSLQSQVSIHQQNYEDFKNSTKDQIANLTREASKTFKLEEEKSKFKRKFEKLKSTSKKFDSVMEEELLSYKSMIKCPICQERNKNAVISKCFHVFCRPCLDSQLNLRQRRCPNCQKPFTATDVHEIYINFN